MTWKDQIFIANVVVINPTKKMVALSVIIQLASAAAKLSAIIKVHKYKRLHEGHHFTLMPMEVRDTPKRDIDCFINRCACLFHDRRLGGHLSLSFCIQLFKQYVNIAFQCALTFAIKRKIMLASDVCPRPPITIRSHNLRVGDIKKAMGEIISYHKKE